LFASEKKKEKKTEKTKSFFIFDKDGMGEHIRTQLGGRINPKTKM
jgi:hypothetical protein